MKTYGIPEEHRKAMGYMDRETGEIKPLELRTPFNYNMDKASEETGLKCEDPTLAQQQFKSETDINTIVKNFGITKELPYNGKVPLEGDYHDAVNDFQSAANIVRQAQESFNAMSSRVRERFNNNPQKLMEFVADPANRDEAERMGIAVPKAPIVPAASQAQEKAENPPEEAKKA